MLLAIHCLRDVHSVTWLPQSNEYPRPATYSKSRHFAPSFCVLVLASTKSSDADAPLAEQCLWWREASGVQVSKTTMSRALSRLGRTQKIESLRTREHAPDARRGRDLTREAKDRGLAPLPPQEPAKLLHRRRLLPDPP